MILHFFRHVRKKLIEQKKVRIYISYTIGEILLVVAGIPDEIKDKTMQPFFTTKKGTQGTGLGLSITNDIVKAHGGTLTIYSIPSEKTIFRISFDKTEYK